ncbi:MAG: hypothetical protein KJ787_11885 [Gammaproteobacteria bacterium]|nr:hypothetical protein [Gammaproteobacteria bacterium]MBU1647022.1 hypothetical protein [Gammaproteobacteria bacterium]MBU1972534.1 hypothetical protein [Gammaproteobacteria bacterium]
MKLIAVISMALFLVSMQSGCGTQIGISGQAREDYLKSIKPYGEYWVKEGGTVELRRQDAWACGSAPHNTGADHVTFTHAQLNAEWHSGETDMDIARSRLRKVWIECMKSKGYEYRRTSP